jgi:hypothetical protein
METLYNVYGNLKSENSPDYVQKPQRNCTFMNSASGLPFLKLCFYLRYGRYLIFTQDNAHAALNGSLVQTLFCVHILF